MKSGIIVVVTLLALVLLTSVTAMNVGYVKADDSGSSGGSSGGSEGGSSGGSSGGNDGGGSSGNDNGGSDKGSNDNGNDSPGDSGSSDKDKDSSNQLPEAKPTPREDKLTPVIDDPNKTPDNSPIAHCDSIGCNPTTDPQPIPKPIDPPVGDCHGFHCPPPVVPHIPDKGCAFHPESDKCKPDKDGNCPPNFAHNDKGNCFPEGKCPSGSSRHDDDESGKCFRDHNHFRVHHHSNSNNNHGSSSHIAWCSTDKVNGVETPFCFSGKNECDKFQNENHGTECRVVVIG